MSLAQHAESLGVRPNLRDAAPRPRSLTIFFFSQRFSFLFSPLHLPSATPLPFSLSLCPPLCLHVCGLHFAMGNGMQLRSFAK